VQNNAWPQQELDEDGSRSDRNGNGELGATAGRRNSGQRPAAEERGAEAGGGTRGRGGRGGARGSGGWPETTRRPDEVVDLEQVSQHEGVHLAEGPADPRRQEALRSTKLLPKYFPATNDA
jgi:hypothetical protein